MLRFQLMIKCWFHLNALHHYYLPSSPIFLLIFSKQMKFVAAVDHDDVGSGKKKVKKGFKVDRRANYERNREKKLFGKESKRKDEAPKRVKSVVFDDRARKEYLLTLHKKKNERRVQAFVDNKRRARRESAKTRQAQKEEARIAYNRFAKVPILPNYTFQLPQYAKDAESDASGGEDEEGSGEPSSRRAVLRQVTQSHSTHALPSAMGGTDDAAAAAWGADAETVDVEVKPLFPTRGAQTRAVLPSSDFSDLPKEVEEELLRLRRESKGPARTKARVHMLKELEKIRKIQKYSRKGHGKRTSSGKRKNRKK